MATVRAERLVNLVLCLLSTRQYLTADRIRGIVPGYADAPSDEAFFRTFERDKAELRDLGIPLETGRNSVFDSADGYRIARRDYELGEIELEPDEAAAVALAARLWDSPEFTGAASGALLKLRAAGVEVDGRSGPPVEPKVHTKEPSFPQLLDAVQEGRVVTFDYRRPVDVRPQRRTVEPWGVVSWRGRWYVVGHDRDREAKRCFRLSRIVGAVTASGPARVVQRPPDVNLLELVIGTERELPPSTVARLWVARDRAHGLRRKSTVVGARTVGGVDGDVLEIELNYPESAASWIAGYGPDAAVIEPDTLRKAVTEIQLGVAGVAERAKDGAR